MGTFKEIHIAAAYGADEILVYNQKHQIGQEFSLGNFALTFPVWKFVPNVVFRRAGETPPDKDSLLLVINLKPEVWEKIKDNLSGYGRTVLVQVEAFVGWEFAYQHADRFDYFINFDRSYASHKGFIHTYIPYLPNNPVSKRDLRGLKAMQAQWVYSRRAFVKTYVLAFLPRWKKSVLIATLHKPDHYNFRLVFAEKWKDWVDVYGGATWPSATTSYRGRCGNKLDILRRYRYTMVMENQRQPGYVTEKLLDAIYVGNIPIYWGAPDVLSLPGSEAIIPIEDEQAPIDKIISDEADYQRRLQILHQTRRQLLEQFSLDNFIQAVIRSIA